MNIGIFLPNWVGDTVMATPTLRALRRHYGPHARLVGIMRPNLAEVLAGTPWLDDTIFYYPHGKDRAHRGWQFYRRLRAERFDVVVLLPNSMRSGLWGWVSGARERVGYVREPRSFLLTRRLYPARRGRKILATSTLDNYLELAYALGCPRESPRIELATLPADRETADYAWRTLGISPGGPLVVLNSSGAFGASKLWPTEYFGELARRVVTEQGHAVLVLCGPDERAVARRIVQFADHESVVSLADARLGEGFPLPIGLSKECVRRATLLVTTDSGPRHFAAAFDVPVVTLFGPIPSSLSETHYPKAVHLHRDLPCAPCMKPRCPLGHHRCMRDLSVDEVYRAVCAQLQPAHVRAA
ncbi:MAG: lipopolysaccharide heptosyltransferase II [Planctomycetia bacterium]|nr:lipopolysaccharide heptosyltransferase II [Planctomycetia bacterium]